MNLREWFAVSLPIFLVESFFFILTNADVLMVGAYMQPDDVAVYFATVKTLALVHFVYFAVKAGVAQRYAQFTHGDPEKLADFARETVAWTFWPSVAMAIVVLLLGEPMLVLFGPGFAQGYPLLFLLVLGVVARAAVGPCESLLTMSGQPERLRRRLCHDARGQHRTQHAADPAFRPLGGRYRHRLLDDLRSRRALLHGVAQAGHRDGDLHPQIRHGKAALMVAMPLIEEVSSGPAGNMLSELAGFDPVAPSRLLRRAGRWTACRAG